MLLLQLNFSFFIYKNRNCKCDKRQERRYVLADLKFCLLYSSTFCLSVFNMRNRSRVMNGHYWPCTLTIDLVSCIMQRHLTIQNYLPHIYSIILLYLRPWEGEGLPCGYIHDEIIPCSNFAEQHDSFLPKTYPLFCTHDDSPWCDRIFLMWEY